MAIREPRTWTQLPISDKIRFGLSGILLLLGIMAGIISILYPSLLGHGITAKQYHIGVPMSLVLLSIIVFISRGVLDAWRQR